MSGRPNRTLKNIGDAFSDAESVLGDTADALETTGNIASNAGTFLGELGNLASAMGLNDVANNLNEVANVANTFGDTMDNLAGAVNMVGELANDMGEIADSIAYMIGPDGNPIKIRKPVKKEYKVHLINEYIPVKGFTLPEGYSWNVEKGRVPLEGVVTVVDKFNSGNMLLCYKDKKLNGESRFYMYGRLIETRTYVDDIADGWACVYDRYEPTKYFIYEEGVKKYQAIPLGDVKPDYWKIIELAKNRITMVCMFDENHAPCGECSIYKKGVIHKVVEYDEDKEIVLKRFKEEEMTEYDRAGNVIYIGGYSEFIEVDKNTFDHDYDYPRHGEGYEMVDDVLFYVGEWKRNMREGYGICILNAFAAYDGQWEKNYPNGFGAFVRNDTIVYEGEWKDGCLTIPNGVFCGLSGTLLNNYAVSTGSEYLTLIKSECSRAPVKCLTINENGCNDIAIAIFRDFMCLEKLIINRSALKNVESLCISRNNRLKEILIEDWDGEDNETCPCRNVRSVVIKDLPNLSLFRAGAASCIFTDVLELRDLPNLTTITILASAFQMNKSVIMKNLPKLANLSVGDYAFYSTTMLTLMNVPFENGIFKRGECCFNTVDLSRVISDSDSESMKNEIVIKK